MSLLERMVYTTSTAYALTRSAIFLAIFFLFMTQYVTTMTKVVGSSMSPTLHDGDLVQVDRFSYHLYPPTRGDVVRLSFPGDPEQEYYVKRLIGLPGEEVVIRDRQIYINGAVLSEGYLFNNKVPMNDGKWVLAPDQYFVMGDNRAASNDSRIFGPVERRFIHGAIRFIVWPTERFRVL